MRLPTSLKRSAAALFLAALAVPAWSSQIARAASIDDNDDYSDTPATRVGRVSRLDGAASLRQTNASEWEDVGTNSPVFEGDEFYTADGARMEIQLGGGRYLRLDERTDVVFANLDEDSARVEVPAGTVIVSLRRIDHGESFQISAPAAAVTLREEGVYRIDVDDQGNTRVGVQKGSARVSGTSRTADLDGGESARFDYNSPDDVDLAGYRGPYDGFDSWSADLDAKYDDAYAQSDQYVGSIGYRNDIYGLSDLASYGTWFDSGAYGWCWRPNAGYGWQPYSNGFWQWYPGYGYTWVSNDPWGWAPYHYGRWAFLNGSGWAWVPWSQFAYGNYYWTPAQVYWYQYPGYNGYSYVPLAPNEPYVDYRRFDRHHQRDFIPQHLRAGRGIGLVQPGSSARLQPVTNARPVKGTDFGGRTPVAVNPDRPKDLTPVKPRFKPILPEPVRTRPLVVDPSAKAGEAKPRGPVIDRHPTRQAAGDSGERVVAKPGRTPAVDDTPTMVEERPAPRRAPVDRKPVVTPDDADKGGDTPAVVKPRRDTGVDGDRTTDRPKPRRIEPTGPPRQNDGGTIDRQPKADRAPKVDRSEPRRADPPPRHEQREQPRQDRQPPPERSAPRAVVERSDPPPPRVERNPDNGGGHRNKPNR